MMEQVDASLMPLGTPATDGNDVQPTTPLKTARVTVVIVNYCTADMVADCLASLVGEIDLDRDRVVVVDNRSPDDSADAIERNIHCQRWGRWCRLIRSDSNDGFSAGNNIGIESQHSEFYWLLNSDTIVRPGALRRLLRAAEGKPNAALIAPRLTWPDGRPQTSRFGFQTPLAEFLTSSQLRVLSRLFGGPYWESPLPESSWVSFASVLIRGEAYADIGPMDEGYFMYYEDMDYCRRVLLRGWTIASESTAEVVHLRGGTSPVKQLASQRRRRPHYFYASRSRYFAKFYGRFGLLVANTNWCLGHLLSLPRDWLGMRQPTACRAEWRDNWINTLRPLTGPRK